MFENKLKKALKNGETKIGTFSMLNSPDIVEIIGISGFDFVVIDTEHGPGSVENTINMVRAAEARGLTPLVRVTEGTTTNILRNLDIGLHGVQVPQVNDVEYAKNVVDASKYHPIGNRGVALSRAGDYGYGSDPLEYFNTSNNETMVVVQCESKESFDNLEEIAKLPHIDVIFFGPFDMSQSLGIPGQVRSKEIETIASEILDICRRNGKVAGIFATDGEQAQQRAEQGFQYILLGMESTLISNALKLEVKRARGL